MDLGLTDQIGALVRELIAQELGTSAGPQALANKAEGEKAMAPAAGGPAPLDAQMLDIQRDPGGFALIKGASVEWECFDAEKLGDRVVYRQLLTSAQSPNLAFGFLEIREAAFDWFLGYDEVDYILRGTWEITVAGHKYVGQAGDTMFIPKNTAVTFSSPDTATVFYTAYPANWEELCAEQPD
ncbi:MAG: cupin domain-containing protein [Coriobacteriia bacterium]|nr:cupin domain-containing protein [Coriobacteriia bacterium]